MSFVQREIDRLQASMDRYKIGVPEWNERYAARQALLWATDPRNYATPLTAISCGAEACDEWLPQPDTAPVSSHA